MEIGSETRKKGLKRFESEKLETDKGAWLIFNATQQGKQTSELIPPIIERALDQLPIPKRMRWGAYTAEFVRPVHWLLLLFGEDVIDTEILTAKAGRETRGHRFHHPETIYIGEPRAYAPILESEGFVMADFTNRFFRVMPHGKWNGSNSWPSSLSSLTLLLPVVKGVAAL